MTAKILLAVLAALLWLLGVHMVFEVAVAATLAAAFMVVHAGTVTGWRTVPRGARA